MAVKCVYTSVRVQWGHEVVVFTDFEVNFLFHSLGYGTLRYDDTDPGLRGRQDSSLGGELPPGGGDYLRVLVKGFKIAEKQNMCI